MHFLGTGVKNEGGEKERKDETENSQKIRKGEQKKEERLRRRKCFHNSCMAIPRIKKTALGDVQDEDSNLCSTVESAISTYTGELLTLLPSGDYEV
jgi:hypothetical protein